MKKWFVFYIKISDDIVLALICFATFVIAFYIIAHVMVEHCYN